MPYIAAGGRMERLVWSTALGTEVRRSQSFGGVAQGTMLTLGGGVGSPPRTAGSRWGRSSAPRDGARGPSSRSTNAELLLDARYRFRPSWRRASVSGRGSPRGSGRRTCALSRWPPSRRSRRWTRTTASAIPKTRARSVPGVRSGDREEERLPAAAGPRRRRHRRRRGRLPRRRRRRARRPEEERLPAAGGPRQATASSTPRTPAPPSAGPAQRRSEEERVPAAARPGRRRGPTPTDACPDIKPGFRSKNPEKNGCPRDTDGDDVPRRQGRLPEGEGLRGSEDPTKNGCPKAVRVTETEIVILQQVQFDTARRRSAGERSAARRGRRGAEGAPGDRAHRDPGSHRQPAAPWSTTGSCRQNRADSVMAALVRRGIDVDETDGRRVTAGTVPIDDNATEAGRQRNRRVQFNIIKQAAYKPQAETGGIDEKAVEHHGASRPHADRA